MVIEKPGKKINVNPYVTMISHNSQNTETFNKFPKKSDASNESVNQGPTLQLSLTGNQLK